MSQSSPYADFLKQLERGEVEWLQLDFVDLVGILRSTLVSSKGLKEEHFIKGIPKLDASSVKGFGTIEFSDLSLLPDINTMHILPWGVDGKRIGRVYAYVLSALEGGHLSRDPRFVATKLESYLSELNLNAYVGAEVEFYLFTEVFVDFSNPHSGIGYKLKSLESPWKSEGYPYVLKEGYYRAKPLDTSYDYRVRLANVLRSHFNVNVNCLHHETGASSQVELDIRHSTPLKTADDVITVKYVARVIAREYGYYVTFMPKPIYGDAGSGMHVHISIWRGGENLFYDENDGYAELSQYARYFIGGILEHGRSLSAITSPTVNSYKRLVPGYEAPVYLTWSRGNRSAAIRIPVYHKGSRSFKRIEYRCPDPLCVPHLAFSAIILAGLDGVKKKIDPGDPVDKNVYHMDDHERKQRGIKTLPRDLYEALDELEADNEYLKPIFTNELIETYVELKRKEYFSVTNHISPAELYYYFSI